MNLLLGKLSRLMVDANAERCLRQRSVHYSSHTSTSCQLPDFSFQSKSQSHISVTKHHQLRSLFDCWTKILCASDSDMGWVSVCARWKGEQGESSAVVSLLCAPAASSTSSSSSSSGGPARQRRGRRQGRSGETAGATLKTVLTPFVTK